MKFARKALVNSVLMLSLVSRAQQANGTFPAVIRIAEKTSNSTERIADTLEFSRSYLPKILDEIKLIREQGERSGTLVEVRTSLGYWAAIVTVGSTIVFAQVGLYNLVSYFFNKYYPPPPPPSPPPGVGPAVDL